MFQDDFQVIKELTGGSGSRLFLVNERISGRKKVLKKPSVPLREGILPELMALEGPNLIHYEGMTDDGFLIMEWAEGETLAEQLRRAGHFSEHETICTGIGLCEALEQLQPYSFGDLKPANIMISRGRPVLIDLDSIFAEGGHTAEFGTMGYAAPERMKSRYCSSSMKTEKTLLNFGFCSDIYSLGIVLLQLLSGISPAALPVESWQKNPDIPALGISSQLWAVLMKAVRKDPGERYQDAREMKEALEKVTAPHSKKKHLPGRRAALAAALLFAVLTTAAAVMFRFRERQEQALHEQYRKILESTDTAEEILQAIALLPSEESGYEVLFSELSADGVLSADEKESLQKLKTGIDSADPEIPEVVFPLDRLEQENPDGFEKICLRAGKLLLFYGEDEPGQEDYQAAAKWLEKISENEEAAVYLSIGQAAEQLEEMEHSRSFEGLGEVCASFWEQIQKLEQTAAGGEPDLSVLICRECIRLTDRYLGLLETEIPADTLREFAEQTIKIGELETDENILQKRERKKLRTEAENLAARIGKETST